MTTIEAAATPADERELVLTRTYDVAAEKLYRCWTEAELLKQWFAPLPFTTPFAELDVRPGGGNKITMRGPDGVDMPNEGVYLDLVPGKKLVFTDAFTAGWRPSGKAFMTVELTFEDLPGGKSLYTARARHWSAEDAKAHAEMGFHEGWGVCADQLGALAATL